MIRNERIKWLIAHLENQTMMTEEWINYQNDRPALVDFPTMYQSYAELRQLITSESPENETHREDE